MRFTTVFFTLATLSAFVAASPLPVAVKARAAAAMTTTTSHWALPTGGTSTTGVHCDPAFLRAADEEDPETGALYRRVCARAQ